MREELEDQIEEEDDIVEADELEDEDDDDIYDLDDDDLDDLDDDDDENFEEEAEEYEEDRGVSKTGVVGGIAVAAAAAAGFHYKEQLIGLAGDFNNTSEALYTPQFDLAAVDYPSELDRLEEIVDEYGIEVYTNPDLITDEDDKKFWEDTQDERDEFLQSQILLRTLAYGTDDQTQQLGASPVTAEDLEDMGDVDLPSELDWLEPLFDLQNPEERAAFIEANEDKIVENAESIQEELETRAQIQDIAEDDDKVERLKAYDGLSSELEEFLSLKNAKKRQEWLENPENYNAIKDDLALIFEIQEITGNSDRLSSVKTMDIDNRLLAFFRLRSDATRAQWLENPENKALLSETLNEDFVDQIDDVVTMRQIASDDKLAAAENFEFEDDLARLNEFYALETYADRMAWMLDNAEWIADNIDEINERFEKEERLEGFIASIESGDEAYQSRLEEYNMQSDPEAERPERSAAEEEFIRRRDVDLPDDLQIVEDILNEEDPDRRAEMLDENEDLIRQNQDRIEFLLSPETESLIEDDDLHEELADFEFSEKNAKASEFYGLETEAERRAWLDENWEWYVENQDNIQEEREEAQRAKQLLDGLGALKELKLDTSLLPWLEDFPKLQEYLSLDSDEAREAWLNNPENRAVLMDNIEEIEKLSQRKLAPLMEFAINLLQGQYDSLAGLSNLDLGEGLEWLEDFLNMSYSERLEWLENPENLEMLQESLESGLGKKLELELLAAEMSAQYDVDDIPRQITKGLSDSEKEQWERFITTRSMEERQEILDNNPSFRLRLQLLVSFEANEDADEYQNYLKQIDNFDDAMRDIFEDKNIPADKRSEFMTESWFRLYADDRPQFNRAMQVVETTSNFVKDNPNAYYWDDDKDGDGTPDALQAIQDNPDKRVIVVTESPHCGVCQDAMDEIVENLEEDDDAIIIVVPYNEQLGGELSNPFEGDANDDYYDFLIEQASGFPTVTEGPYSDDENDRQNVSVQYRTEGQRAAEEEAEERVARVMAGEEPAAPERRRGFSFPWAR